MINYYEIAYDSLGVYPQKIGENFRTEWQDGWNACGSALIDNVILIQDWVNQHSKKELIEELLSNNGVFVSLKDKKVIISYNSGDIFAWGYADAELITEDMIEEVSNALNQPWGIIKYHCRRYNQKPQWPIERDMRKDGEWDLEDLPECEYDRSVRWLEKTRLEAIKELENGS